MGLSLFRSTSIEDHLRFEQSRWRYYEEKIRLYDYFDLHFPNQNPDQTMNDQGSAFLSEERKISLIEDELRKRFLWKNGRPFQYIGPMELSI